MGLHFIAHAAVAGLLLEAATWPSPGLVSPFGNGGHSDMSYLSFLMGAAALAPTFLDCAEAGFGHHGPLPELLHRLRPIGRRGEEAMIKATAGANTQKGALFILGVLCGACGYLIRNSQAPRLLDIQAAVREMTQGLVETELAPLSEDEAITHGERIFRRYGLTGVRGEVAAGFPSVIQIGYPTFEGALKSGLGLSEALVKTLVALIATTEDTTVLHRHPLETLVEIRAKARGIMDQGDLSTTEGRAALFALDRELATRRISPGGSADLLAATVFFYLVSNPHGFTEFQLLQRSSVVPSP